jgi:SPP1 family predicted phage head-tail adaptor
MIIEAGKLNKIIEIEHLKIERDQYGSDVEKWRKIFKCKTQVLGSDSSTLQNAGEEILIQDRLIFTIRYVHFLAFDLANHYRIVYNNKIYNVLNINAEEEDIMKITCILKNI